MIPVTMDIPKRKADSSVKLSFTTNSEVTTDDYMTMDSYRQSAGWLLFRENEFTEEDIPVEDVDAEIGKSQATQVRDALWVLFIAKGGKTEDKEAWNIFYRKQMQNYKAKILEQVRLLEEAS
jgi:hypothetical protein